MTFSLEKVVRPNILKLKPYRCARDDYSEGILLDANENSHGPSLDKDYPEFGKLERYPDPYQVDIKKLLCAYRGIPSTDHFFLGVGSDECIDMTMRVFVKPGVEKILITPPTYGMYSVSAQINDVEVVKVPLIVENGLFQLNVPQMFQALKDDPSIKVVYLCSPGNPTGTLLNHNDIRQILEYPHFQGIVVVDEAYIDFCEDGSSVSTWVTSYPNLIVSQTVSKAFGLAAIRLGYTVSSKEIAQIFNNTKAPYNISTPTATLAQRALSPEGLNVMKGYIASIKKQRGGLLTALAKLKFVKGFLGSNDANFIMTQFANQEGVPCNDTAFRIYKQLAEVEGIVVRYRGNELGCTGCLRITIGTPEENETLIQKLTLLQ